MSAKRNKMPLGQTEIPIPPAPRAIAEFTTADKERAYADQLGEEAAARQRAEWHRLHDCNCGRQRHPHASGCPASRNAARRA